MNEELKALLEQLKGIMPDLSELQKTAKDTGASVQELKTAFEELGTDKDAIKEEVANIKAKIEKDKKYARLNSISKGNMDGEAKRDFFDFVKNVWRYSDPAGNPEKGAIAEQIKDFQSKYSIEGDPEHSLKDTMNTTDDGFLIPQSFTNQIQAVADQASVGLREATVIPIGRGNQLPQINLDTDVNAYWTGENVTFTQSEPEATQSRTKLKKLAAYAEFTNEYIEDEEVGIVNWLISRFGMKMGVKIDNELFQGDGTNFTGILNASGTNVVNMGTGDLAANIDFDDLVDVEEALPTSLIEMAPKWYAHKTVVSYLKKIKDTDNGYLWQPAAGQEPANIWGYGFTKADQMPTAASVAAATAFLIFGNLKNYGIGTKGGYSIMRDMNIKDDKSILAVRRRYALNTLLPDAFVVLKTGAAS